KAVLLVLALGVLTSCGDFFGPRDDNGGGGNGNTGTPRFLYAANFSGGVGAGTISAFTVNSSSGALTQVATSPFNAGTGPNGIGSDSAGQFVYVSNQSGGVSGFVVDRNSGALTALNSGNPFSTGTNPVSVTVDPGAHFVYVANGGSSSISGYT